MRRLLRLLGLASYYGLFRFLPVSYTPVVGPTCRFLRTRAACLALKQCATTANIESHARFGSGARLSVGDRSGIGVNAMITGTVDIADNVMMGPDVVIIRHNHRSDNLSVPMIDQVHTEDVPLVIESDVWIGTRVIILPGCRRIGSGSILGAGSVVTKDVPPRSVVGGNPARVLRER
jgi:maltose O-acetyltransferase